MIGAQLHEHAPNLTQAEWDGIKSLQVQQKNRQIIVKPNDKTGGCSILDFDSYVETMRAKLKDTFVGKDGEVMQKYSRVDSKDLQTSWTRVRDIVKEGQQCGYIYDANAAMMVPDSPKPGRLYGLVKDHKPVDPNSGIPPLREVISGSGSNTEFISAYVDYHCKAEVKKLPSFIEDTPHFLRDISEFNERGRLPEQAILVSMDVTALYPSIPWKEGLEATKEALTRREDRTVPDSFILRLMLLVLGSNIFEFDSELWLQKDGTAMGTRAAPTFANIFMDKWEERSQSGWTGSQIEFWRRFIDDIFFIWLGTEADLKEFVKFVNSLLPSIKVTVEYNIQSRSVNYLDVTVFIDNDGYLRTDLYKKENLKISYLMPTSSHPDHISKNIPYSLAYRIKRICWNDELFERRISELSEALVLQGYKYKSIQDSIDRVRKIS